VGAWNVSHVTNMVHMFCGASAFKCDLSAWDTISAIGSLDRDSGNNYTRTTRLKRRRMK
jgi:hypothetical protein